MNDTGEYKRLRENLQTTKAMDMMFVQIAVKDDGLTAAIITMAALDVPVERAAVLVGREVDEIDSRVGLFNVLLTRSIAAERLQRKGLL